MYYNRSLPTGMEALLAPRGALEWLPAFLRTLPDGITRTQRDALALADVQLRRDESGRRLGCIQVYAGSTCLLDLRGTERGVTLHADEKYRKVDEDLLDTVEIPELAARAQRIKTYLVNAARLVDKRYVSGESRLHALFMRRHGFAPPGNVRPSFVALDREVVIGHDDSATRDAQSTDFRTWVASIGSRIAPDRNSCELDVLGIDEDGATALVELKHRGASAATAVQQVAFYIWRFEQLAKSASGLSGVKALLEQKRRLGFVPEGPGLAKRGDAFRLVPVIAALDDEPSTWATRWHREIEATVGRHDGLLKHLRLWRLDEDGRIADRA